MAGSEKRLVNRILHELNSWPQTKALKLHGSIFSETGTADILGCIHGRMFMIEVKAIGKTPSKIQCVRMHQWKAAGAHVGWTDQFDTAIAIARAALPKTQKSARHSETHYDEHSPGKCE